MQQRASLCRALIHDPKLLMLDEPFGALDAFTREELWGVLQKLWLDRKFTCVLVTHDLREAAFLADTHLRHERAARPHRCDPPRRRCRGRARWKARSRSPSSTSCTPYGPRFPACATKPASRRGQRPSDMKAA